MGKKVRTKLNALEAFGKAEADELARNISAEDVDVLRSGEDMRGVMKRTVGRYDEVKPSPAGRVGRVMLELYSKVPPDWEGGVFKALKTVGEALKGLDEDRILAVKRTAPEHEPVVSREEGIRYAQEKVRKIVGDEVRMADAYRKAHSYDGTASRAFELAYADELVRLLSRYTNTEPAVMARNFGRRGASPDRLRGIVRRAEMRGALAGLGAGASVVAGRAAEAVGDAARGAGDMLSNIRLSGGFDTPDYTSDFTDKGVARRRQRGR